MNLEKIITPKVPVLLVGAVGIGKTATIKNMFDYSEVMLASTMVEEDIAGLPYKQGKYDYRTVSGMFRRLEMADKAGKTTVLFLDELDKSRRSVADTLLTLVASRTIGDISLPDNTCIVAAANPPEFSGGDGISDAMISRFCVINYLPSVKGWCCWAKKKYNSTLCKNVIDAIEKGLINILDIEGEGLEKRISTPRTISMAMDFLEDGCDQKTFEKISAGLMTVNTSSKITNFAFNVKDQTVKKSVKIATRQQTKHKPFVF
jgi:hypothetical protein